MELKTKKLILKTVTYDDLDEVARMWNFEKGEISVEEAKKAVDWMNGNHKRNRLHKIAHICFAIFEKNKDRIIGWCGLDGGYGSNKDKNKIEIFYLIGKNYRKRGYATECAKKLLEYGFLKMEVSRIDGGCAKDNIDSKKVLERIGMRNMTIKEDGSLHYFLTLKEYKNYIEDEKLI